MTKFNQFGMFLDNSILLTLGQGGMLHLTRWDLDPFGKKV